MQFLKYATDNIVTSAMRTTTATTAPLFHNFSYNFRYYCCYYKNYYYYYTLLKQRGARRMIRKIESLNLGVGYFGCQGMLGWLGNCDITVSCDQGFTIR